MVFRADKVVVQIDGVIEFEGRQTIRFEYAPLQDDQLVALALQRNREMIMSEIQNQDMPEGLFF